MNFATDSPDTLRTAMVDNILAACYTTTPAVEQTSLRHDIRNVLAAS